MSEVLNKEKMGQNWKVWTRSSEEGWVSHAPNQNAGHPFGGGYDSRPES